MTTGEQVLPADALRAQRRRDGVTMPTEASQQVPDERVAETSMDAGLRSAVQVTPHPARAGR
jgi:hypothetical protein